MGERGDNIYMYSDPHSPPNTHAKKDLPKKKINKIQSFQMHFLKRRSDIYKKIRQGRSSFHTRAYIYRITVSKYLRWGLMGGSGGGRLYTWKEHCPSFRPHLRGFLRRWGISSEELLYKMSVSQVTVGGLWFMYTLVLLLFVQCPLHSTIHHSL